MYNIIIGIVFLVGGLSGRLALLGTNSTSALAGVGIGLIAWGAYQEYRKRTSR